MRAVVEALARGIGGDWLRRLDGRDRGRHPLFFHHVPKTAGTSLIDAIGKQTRPELIATEQGKLSAAFVGELVGRGLEPGQFIHGHPALGAAAPLRGKTHIVTFLREPCDQVISNYLYVRRDWRVPDHRAAQILGFREFVLARPRFAIFQTASLHLGIAERAVDRVDDLVDAAPSVLAYLDEMTLVGVVDEAKGFMLRLAEIMGWPRAPRFPHRRKARISHDERERMRGQFADLQDHPQLSPLFAAERAVYLHARAIAERDLARSRCPDHMLDAVRDRQATPQRG